MAKLGRPEGATGGGKWQRLILQVAAERSRFTVDQVLEAKFGDWVLEAQYGDYPAKLNRARRAIQHALRTMVKREELAVVPLPPRPGQQQLWYGLPDEDTGFGITWGEFAKCVKALLQATNAGGDEIYQRAAGLAEVPVETIRLAANGYRSLLMGIG